ncbi:MAG: hypothetical protein HY537_09810 [Deltaproteobacteria bacterium]|nr:hypothetical protein [Deltaproteobacteria bacterium]
MTEKPLIGLPGLILFTFVVIMALCFALPTDFELARLRSLSYQSSDAEKLLRKSLVFHPNDPLIVRNLLDVLEKKGDVKEAIELSEQLTRLRPKNVAYWQRRIRLLEWAGLSLSAVRVREQMLRAGAEPYTRKALMKLVDDYEWLQRPADASRVLEEVWLHKIYEKDDIDDVIRLLLNTGKPDGAENFALESVKRGLTNQDVHLHLLWEFVERKKIERAIRQAAYYFGATAEEGEKAWENSTFFYALSDEQVSKHRKLIEDVGWLYINHGKPRLGALLIGRLESKQFLNLDTHFAFADLLIQLGETSEASGVFHRISLRPSLRLKDWKKIARGFIATGEQEVATLILENILEGRTPTIK